MDFFDLVNISERYIQLINPTSPEKVIKIGKILRLHPESRVIDFGCGYGELLALWGENFGISGVGIDIREHACQRARQRIKNAGLTERIEITCENGAEYSFLDRHYDAAVCTGASFIWGKFSAALKVLSTAVHAKGKIVIGEPYWLRDEIPAAYRQQLDDVYSEHELLGQIRAADLELEYLVRASNDDWDRYEAENWHGLVRWLEENPGHPERVSVIKHLRKNQEEYLQFGRQYLGWEIFVLGFRQTV